jgi:hypothetical protein
MKFNVKSHLKDEINVEDHCYRISVCGSYSNVTCIARQRTGKHLTTEYKHTTIELRKILLVAR